ncbi:FAD:protein FMN transferase [Butyrivibrio sp. LC3010]|uniref:FAD:protein FMN transferase n=1 Tax=Butyrivibrio sp. LC3010 TaxID=1280680 RepID=UPI000416CA38|nr:FAD:protein FMN transferase [Butyrivibrio sp. LC3010]
MICFQGHNMYSIRAYARSYLWAIIILTIVFLCIQVSGCAVASTEESNQKVGFYFDTVITLTAYNKDFLSNDSPFFTKNADASERCLSFLDECLLQCDHYEKLFSTQKKHSDIWNINHSFGNSVEIDYSTYDLLSKALYYAELSNGAFDPTIGKITDLWDFHADSGKQLPDHNVVEKDLLHVDYKNIKLTKEDGKYYARLLDPESKIDLGGIAKGYIADKLKEFYKEKGVRNGIINLGGNVLLVGGKPANGASYNVGIQRPFGEASESMLTLSLKDKSVVTSGIYDRYFEKNGILYHHILNTATGFPVRNNVYSATIVSDSSVDGDALSTICLSLGVEKGMDLIDSIPDTYVLFITDKYEVVYSDGFPGLNP